MAIRTTENEVWGTLEELCLACAVKRYGANDWDSIVRELQKQTSRRNLYNSQNCRLKFEDLRRRFAVSGVEEVVVLQTIEDELRKARIAELRRKMDRSDISIRLLQSKLKQLKEEDEEEEEAKPEEVADLVCDTDKRKPVGNSAVEEEVAEVSGDDSDDRADRSPLKQRPLIRMLVLIRSQENSSFFESQLPSQETREYKDMVKQHIDLKTVEANMKQGMYLNSEARFFRDLLVMFTNFTVFFPTNSPEYIAAEEIRKLVITEMRTGVLLAPAEPEAAPCIASDNKEANPLMKCRRWSPTYPTEDSEAKSKDLHHDGKAEVVIAKKDMVRRGRPLLNRRELRSSSSKVSNGEETVEGKGKEERRSEISRRETRSRIRERNRIDISDEDKEIGTRPKRDKAKSSKTSDHRKNLPKEGDEDGEMGIRLENGEKTSKAEAKIRDRNSTDNGKVEEVEEVKVKRRGRPPKKDVLSRMKVVMESSNEEDEVVEVKKRDSGREEPKREQQTSGGPRRSGRLRKSSLSPPITRASRRVVGRVKREPEEEIDDSAPSTKPTRR